MTDTMTQSRRRAGWSEEESNLLWEAAAEAEKQGMPLKNVFEQIATQTGRRPNSIRNYYYAQAQKRAGSTPRPARFVPFSQQEVDDLMEKVLRARAQGHSVRSCLQQLAGGDHSLMLRYQNKYRSVIKSRPEVARQAVEKLRAEGVEAEVPHVNHRARTTLREACDGLIGSARLSDDPDLVHACEALSRLIREKRQQPRSDDPAVRLDLYRMALEDKQRTIEQLVECTQGLIASLKEFLGQSQQAREGQLGAFCASISERIGLLEARLAESVPQ